MKITRRDLIRQSCCAAAALGMASSFSRFGLIHALAQSPTNYQALVCIFLFGGNDANNMLIPTDTAGYANYLKYRVAVANGGLALDQSTLLPITSKTAQNGQTSFGLHPNLPEVQALFTSGQLAFLANVGPLAQPVTRAQYLAQQLCPFRQIFFRMPISSSSGRRSNSMASTRPAGPAASPITSTAASIRVRCFRRSPPWPARRFSAPASRPSPTPSFPAPRRAFPASIAPHRARRACRPCSNCSPSIRAFR